ncbi:MAG: hypothetical protein EAZ70_10110 [Runella slithyformis]|nr:MAG: hypothetical protein EAY79_10855 [Runella slithyformis]TAE93570.1 MAG: hypothetical protein EAZ80_11385 [Runella slithyformis]TAF25489.1 MAG: hypothetical protein EAZ70_10110 [Runella slithyformis]TAF43809.1 MAG: hypothetical protein EAZ63_13290 [Runella slithyformis]TAF79887.1 MAG: hypothetical protein EAZ50_10215 [Runella slithyformis]
MKLLLDENIDVRFKFCFDAAEHEVLTVRDMEWNGIKNGKLLRLAADYGFKAFICVDKNQPYQQNLAILELPVIVIDVHKNVLPSLKQVYPVLVELLKNSLENKVYVIK